MSLKPAVKGVAPTLLAFVISWILGDFIQCLQADWLKLTIFLSFDHWTLCLYLYYEVLLNKL